MGGWRRIGIVLSMIWFLGFGFFLWIYNERDHSKLFEIGLHNCELTFKMAEEALDAELDRIPLQQKIENPRAEAQAFMERQAKWHVIFERRNKCQADATSLSEISRSRSTELAVVVMADLVTVGF